MISGNPNTFIVGAGPVATALAGALRRVGSPVLGLWARDPAAAREAGASAGVATFSTAPPDLLLEAEVTILAVRDAAIAEVAAMLVATGLISRRHVMLHCSGAISSHEAFGDVADELGGVGVIHPLRAIADRWDGRRAASELAGAAFGVEGDTAGLEAAQVLVRRLGGRALMLAGEQMATYHAAAAIASNYAVTLLDAACALLSRAGIEERDALAALLPLVRGSLDNAAERGVAGGLTGPIRRGDADTVKRHLDAIGDDGSLRALYALLGQRALAIAERAGDLSDTDRSELASLLADPDRSSR